MKQEIEELAQLFDNHSDCYADSDDVIIAMTKEKFIEVVAGYSQAMEQPKWVSIADKGLPTDNEVGYFIARGSFFHRNLYWLSDVLAMYEGYQITHYMPFNLPNPPTK